MPPSSSRKPPSAAASLLALFHQRRRVGLGPLYLVLGTLQFAQFVLAVSIRVEIAPGFSISPATAVLFPLTVMVVLLTYVEDDAEATRSLAYGIVICNLTLYAVTTMTGQHLRYPGHENVLGLAPDAVQQPGRIILASSLAIVADLVGAIVVFEAISRRVTSTLFLRLWTTAVLVCGLRLGGSGHGAASRRADAQIGGGGGTATSTTSTTSHTTVTDDLVAVEEYRTQVTVVDGVVVFDQGVTPQSAHQRSRPSKPWPQPRSAAPAVR